MKNFWQKLPAWLRAIVLTAVLLVPILLLKQTIVSYTLKLFPQFGFVALLLIAGILFLYWRLLNILSPFKAESDIKISIDSFSPFNMARILGLMLLTISCLSLPSAFLGVDNAGNGPDPFYELLNQVSALTAISILIAKSLSAGVVEEITFRGFVQNTTSQKYPRIVSYLIVGMIFALLHFSPILFISYILLSVGFSIVADQQKSVGVVVVAHVITDIFLLLMPYFNPSIGQEEVGLTGTLMLLGMLAVAIVLIFGVKPKKKLAVS